MKLIEVWRYPVKSMRGERLTRAAVGGLGIAGDRGWALRDETAGEIRGAKKIPALLQCRARYLSEPRAGSIPPAEITLPDGEKLRSDDGHAAAKLSTVLGRAVTIWPLQPAENREHYRHGIPDDPDLMKELRSIFGRLEDEPLPDLSVFPSELFKYTSPLGTYFDAFPLHLLTTATLTALRQRNRGAGFEVERFRPNLVVDTLDAEGFIENEWGGRTLRLGSVRIKAQVACPRCVMTTLPQADLPHDPSVLRTIVRDAAQNVGIYLTVEAPGEISVGDEVVVEP